MKKKLVSSLVLSMVCMTVGCGSGASSQQAADTASVENSAVASSADSTQDSSADEQEAAAEASLAESTDGAAEASTESTSDDATVIDDVTMRIGSLKGPTTIGIVNLLKDNEGNGLYENTLYVQPSDVMTAMVAGEIDAALVPSNVACVMNKKVEGGVTVVDINTLGVLECVTADETITSVKDLAGKTVVTTGQGATPEYSLRYLLNANEVTDCELEFKSEATEIAAVLEENPDTIAVVPQPFATAVKVKNENVKTAFTLNDEWDKTGADSKMVTGVTVVSNQFLAEHADVVDQFIANHAQSVEKCNNDVETTAQLVADLGIIEKAPIAAKAIPSCNIVCITGEEMKTALSGYLGVLFEQDPKSVGGGLPEDSFYYVQ